MPMRGKPRKPVVDRFMAFVDKNGPTMPGMLDNCWNFLGGGTGGRSKNPAGQIVRRGQFNGYGLPNGLEIESLAPRAAWRIFRGEIPDGLWVLHKCHNSVCVNPDHLYLGDRDKNMAHMVQAGRAAKGSDNGSSKLDEIQVREIRLLYATGNWTLNQLAKKYGVSIHAIWQVVHYLTWKHI